MNRRDFVSALSLQQGKLPDYPLDGKDNAYRNVTLPLDLDMPVYNVSPYAGAWGADQAMHLLRRTTFGFRLEDVDLLKSKNMSDAVDAILSISDFKPAPPLNNYNNPRLTDPNIPFGSTWVNDTTTPVDVANARANSFKSWSAGLMLNQDANIREKMTLFWHNHFATEINTVQDARASYKLNQYLRENCIGNFKQMVKDVSKDASMLFYLNGYLNTKTAPDENYARELFELFTLGKSADSQYTEADIVASAKVLTGWRINPQTMTSFFQANLHETADKTFSAFFNNTVIKGKTGAAGANEKDELVDMIFEKKEVVAKFICRKLYRFFCYYVIDSQTESDVIVPLSQTLINNNWEILPVLRQLFKSEHFFDMNSQSCHIKNPFDFLLGYSRLFGAVIPTDLAKQYMAWNIINSFAAIQGMNLGDPPSVAGWPAYYQEPQYHQIWINSDTLSKRKQFIEALLFPTGIVAQGTSITVDMIAFVSRLTQPEDPNLLISQVCGLCSAYPISDAKKAEMKSILLSGQAQDFYWTDAWNTYKADPGNQMNYQAVYLRLFSFFQLLLTLPECQLA